MHQFLGRWLIVLFLGSGGVAWARLTPEQREQLPPPAGHAVSFPKEVRPLLEASCTKCHGRGKANGEFRLDTRETLLKGGESGPAVLPGNSAESYLIELVSGLDPDNVMPQKGSKLTREQVGILRAWIDQGLPWEEGVSFGRIPPLNLTPPEPAIPAGPAAAAAGNGIDSLLKPYWHQHGITQPKLVTDRVFARRVYLDILGVLPSSGELEQFISDDKPDKRDRLVRQLLTDNRRYAEHWLTFWNDLLRNDYKGTGYIDEGRKQITDWLYSALARNLPFDQFVRQLICPTPESEGFVKGIVWRGVVNASQTPQMQAAQNISQVFMGVNLKCASCHDSFINDWMLADAYGLASIYSDTELELVRCDKPTGKKAVMKFLYPELGSIDSTLPKGERLQQLADVMTQKRNGRLARTIVNRLWAKFMGRGLVEPLDDMEQKAWSPDVLDWLAADLVANGYDLRKTMARILTSQAYQSESVQATETVAKDFVFRGPLVRRLTAEQFEDALSAVTGVWHPLPTNPQADFSAGSLDPVLSETQNPARVRWIWNAPEAINHAAPGTVYFCRTVNLPMMPTQAAVVITCDNSFTLFVNGKEVGSGGEYGKPKIYDLLPHLHPGENLFAVRAVNDSAGRKEKDIEQSNPAGLLLYARIRHESGGEAERTRMRIWDVASDQAWLCSTDKIQDWQTSTSISREWARAVELGLPEMEPWHVEKKFVQSVSAISLAGHVRAALVAADPLMTALGRPNREQVITTRGSNATTLQALEMTNGQTLSDFLERASDKLMEEKLPPPRDWVTQLFVRALARTPTLEELVLAEQLVGNPLKKDGMEDLLWAVAMLPEFQLIY